MQRLKLIKSNPEKKPAAKIEQLICRECKGSHFIKTKMAPVVKAGKVSGGTDAMICVYCLSKGKVHREI